MTIIETRLRAGRFQREKIPVLFAFGLINEKAIHWITVG